MQLDCHIKYILIFLVYVWLCFLFLLTLIYCDHRHLVMATLRIISMLVLLPYVYSKVTVGKYLCSIHKFTYSQSNFKGNCRINCFSTVLISIQASKRRTIALTMKYPRKKKRTHQNTILNMEKEITRVTLCLPKRKRNCCIGMEKTGLLTLTFGLELDHLSTFHT